MPLYPVVNKNTGETKELSMTIAQWEEWKEENFKNSENWGDKLLLLHKKKILQHLVRST